MEGINAIKKDEEFRKRLKHLVRSKRGCFVSQIIGNNCNIHEFCDEDKCDYITEINESFIKNKRIPQIMDTEIYKHI